MAEIDHPRLRQASASTSSLPENMSGGSSSLAGVGTVSVEGSPPRWWTYIEAATTTLKGWGKSVTESGERTVIATNRARPTRSR